ncbi:MAG: DUF4340 domain-containing protein [Timaviella obliquedivisa GSE-PSE-MK23-08B]|jgi:hypothetical protein|nr:DUF4340 domain-containing protein [Timaviella obliquedivisa GSE-PSE-MK23-08B]
MKIKPATLFLVLAALLLGGVVMVVGNQRPPEQTENDEGQQLFAFEEKQVQSLTVKTRLRSLKFERDQSGKWQMIEPDKAAASDASIAYLLGLLAGKSDRTFTALAGDRESFSFHQPLATINVVLNNQETHRLLLGGYDFNRSFIYALVDPPPALSGEIKVFLASPSFENAVDRPLEEWKELAPNPSPSESPSASPRVSPEASPEASPPPVSTSPEPSSAPSPTLSPEASSSPTP